MFCAINLSSHTLHERGTSPQAIFRFQSSQSLCLGTSSSAASIEAPRDRFWSACVPMRHRDPHSVNHIHILQSTISTSQSTTGQWKARALVRSPLYKPCADDLVVWWVTTGESSLLIVLFCQFLHALGLPSLSAAVGG